MALYSPASVITFLDIADTITTNNENIKGRYGVECQLI